MQSQRHVRIEPGFAQTERAALAGMVWQGLPPVLRAILGPQGRAEALLAGALVPDRALVARGPGGDLRALAGLRWGAGGFFAPGPEDFARIYGAPGGRLRGWATGLADVAVPEDLLLLDGLFVAAAHRRGGLGAALVAAALAEGQARGLGRLGLLVAPGNHAARALYLRQGLRVTGRRGGLANRLTGLGAGLWMETPLPPCGCHPPRGTVRLSGAEGG